MRWHFYGFDRHAFDQVFGGGDTVGIELIQDALQDPALFDLLDLALAGQVVDALAEQGLDCEGMSEDERDILDCAIYSAFKSSQLPQRLSVVPLSNEPLSVEALPRLAAACRSKETRPIYEALQTGGRRIGQVSPAYCNYMLLDPHEVAALVHDAQQYLAQPSVAEDERLHLEASLMSPLAQAAKSGSATMAFFS